MMVKRWCSITLGVFLSVFLYGCLGGKIPVVGDNSLVQQADQPERVYLPSISLAPPPEPAGPPLPSNSIYITTIDSATLYNQGCLVGSRDQNLAGKQDSVVVLHFGYPRMVNNQYGARLYSPAGPATVDQIAAAVQQFGYGYWYCVGSDFDSHLRIGIGTSNYGGSIYSLVTAGHGQAWARMVNQVNDWFKNTCTRGCDGQVDAVGASDIELPWASYDTTYDWLVGYESANNSPLYNFGAIPGCPYFAYPNASCGGGYTKEQVWMVTYGLSSVFPMPEIYRTDGANAQQWYLMSVYSYVNKGMKMQFIGPMSQYQACLQRGGCNTIDNTSEQAWNQLYTLLNGDPRTSGQALPYVTDIFWLNEPYQYMTNLPAQQTPEAAAAPTSVMPATPPVSAPETLVEGLQAALRSDRLSEVDRKSMEEKLRLAQQLTAQTVVKSASPGEKTQMQSLLPLMEGGTGYSTEEEIIEGSEGVLRTWEASIQNLWEGQRNGLYYQVLAGASVDDPEQSLLFVVETNPSTNQRDQQFFLTSEKMGALRIVQVQGTKVSLTSANGGKLIFDLSTKTFQ